VSPTTVAGRGGRRRAADIVASAGGRRRPAAPL